MGRRHLLLALLASATAAADPVGDAADAVSAAFRAGDTARLKDLAARDDPDPWLVADELCARADHDAADAFARAAPRKDVESLPAFVASRRGKAADAAARKVLAAAADAVAAKDYALALKLVEECAAPEDDPILAIRFVYVRSRALRELSRPAESIDAAVAAARTARSLGWLPRAAVALNLAAATAYQRSDFSGARALWEERLAVEEGRANRAGTARALAGIGDCHRALRDHARALSYYERALELTEDRAETARVLGCSGDCHRELRDYVNALKSYERLLRLREELGDRSSVASVLTAIGTMHRSLSDYPKALESYERALKLQEELGDRSALAQTLENLGDAHRLLADCRVALEYYERSLKIREELKDRARVSSCLVGMGLARYQLGDYTGALDAYGRTLELMQELGDRAGTAETLGRIGATHHFLGDYARALEFHERSLRLSEELGDRHGEVRALVNLGASHDALGDHHQALEWCRRALEASEELEDPSFIASALTGMGAVHVSLSDYPAALDCFERSRKLCEELGDRADLASLLRQIGDVHLSLGDSPKALEACERSLKLSEELGDRRGQATAHLSLGNVHRRLGDNGKALEHYERSLKLELEFGSRVAAARALGNIGNVHHAIGHHAKALEQFEQVLKLLTEFGDRGGAAIALLKIGEAHHSLGDYPRALEYAERGRSEAEQLGARDTMFGAVSVSARAHFARGDPAAAAASCRTAAGLLGQLATGLAEEQGARAREQHASILDIGTEAALQLDDAREVSFFLESGRAATLLEALGGRDALRAAALPEELRVEEATARAEEAAAARRQKTALDQGRLEAIRGEKRQLDAAQERVAEVIGRIQRQEKARASVVYPEADSLDAIRGRLREGETLVLYGLPRPEAVALVVTRGEARIVRLGGTKEIEEACAAEATENADAIARLVIEPLELKEEARRVLVSPAGALSCVPFALLLGDREVAYVPSGTTYGVLLGEGGLRGEGVLAVGDPGSSGAALSGAREEAKAVGDVVLLGEEATERGLLDAVAKRPRWRAVHLACHGLIDSERPLLSSLALAGGDSLTTLDIFRAVSLWKVDDEATRALMTRFYEEWKTKPAATALRAAQEFVASHEKWKHPKYWAAWQLWGLPE